MRLFEFKSKGQSVEKIKERTSPWNLGRYLGAGAGQEGVSRN